MFTNTDVKLSIFYKLILFCDLLFISTGSCSTTEKNSLFLQNTKPCLPCDKSKHHTLKSLQQNDSIIILGSDEECYNGGILSPLMNYHQLFGELDLSISIVRPFLNKNEWCSFQVYWKDEIQASFLVNENGSIHSNSSKWSLEPNTGTTKFWLVRKKMSADNSGKD